MTLILLGILWVLCGGKVQASAKSTQTMEEAQQQETNQQETSQGDYTLQDVLYTTDEMAGQLDVSGIEDVIHEMEAPLDMTFLELVKTIIGVNEVDGEQILDNLFQLVFQEFIANKNYMYQLLLLSIGFALLKNFAEIFDKSYISNICFLLVYCLFIVLLMRSLFTVNDIVISAVQNVIDFMTAFIPVFATTMVFSTGAATAGGFYQLAYLLVYILQWILQYVVIPLIKIYVVFGFLNHVLEEGRLYKLTELMETVVRWILRLITTGILGLNIFKTAITPLTDSLTRNTLRRSLSMIPGVGNVLHAASDLFLTSGAIIRNGVGLAALVVLVIICLIPLIKLIILTFMYKLLAAVVEPVCDPRICDALSVVSKGSGMLFQVLASCIVLVFITVAMTTMLV